LLSLLPLVRLAEADDIALDGHLARRSLFKLGELHQPDVPHRDCHFFNGLLRARLALLPCQQKLAHRCRLGDLDAVRVPAQRMD
jgi:hypothetical protein